MDQHLDNVLFLCFTPYCRIVRNFETFGARIELPDSGAFTVSRTSYSLTITEVSADNVPTTGYGVDFGDDTSDSFQLPKSLFNTGSTRVSASLIKSVGIFSGRDSTKVVASNVVSLTLTGGTVLNLENSVIITITKLANVSLPARFEPKMYLTYCRHQKTFPLCNCCTINCGIVTL